MNKDRYIVIHEWMLDLGLEPSETIAFALIWGTCRTCGEFRGGAKEVCKWAGWKPRYAKYFGQILRNAGVMTIKRGSHPVYIIPENVQFNIKVIGQSIAHMKMQRIAQLKEQSIAQLNGQSVAQFNKGNIEGNIEVIKEEKEERPLTHTEILERYFEKQRKEREMEAKYGRS